MNLIMKPEAIVAEPRIILFDGVCVLCNAWARFILRYDRQRNFKLCSVQSSSGQAILSYYGYPTDEFKTMLYIENETLFERSGAFIRVIRQMPFPFKLLAVFWIIPRPLRDWGYDLIAQNRYRLFGRYEQCRMPDASQRDRFL